jgi:ribosome-associated toxin RatA of RatAB toxin-antitoxin module
MRTVDTLFVPAAPEAMFALAAEVEQWPRHLPHYRYVRIEERRDNESIVAMSANRPFGPFDWPTWWTSRMWVDRAAGTVRYRHIKGVTTGMDVEWRIESREGGCFVTLIHEWDGPRWGPLRRPAANWVIGPVFVHGIASRTLAGLARALERPHG